jgi:hypothetical protein
MIQFRKFSNSHCYGTITMKEVDLLLIVQNFTTFETLSVDGPVEHGCPGIAEGYMNVFCMNNGKF